MSIWIPVHSKEDRNFLRHSRRFVRNDIVVAGSPKAECKNVLFTYAIQPF